MIGVMPKFSAVDTAPETNLSALQINSTRPAIMAKENNNIQRIALVATFRAMHFAELVVPVQPFLSWLD